MLEMDRAHAKCESEMLDTAANNNIAVCHLCLKLSRIDDVQCARCGSSVHLRKTDSVQRTLALLTAACLLYVPANLYPIMYTDQLGSTAPSTIMGGVLLLIDLGSAPIAVVIFVFSIVVPSAKLMAMFYLVWTVRFCPHAEPKPRLRLYRIIEFIGKWSMVDVFVVAILVALIQLDGLMVIRPGIAAVSFAGVVLLTIVATESFDPRLIWDSEEREKW